MSTLREDFESWGAREGSNLSRHPGRPEQYANTAIQGRWLAYQAATERAATLCDEQAEFHQDMHNSQAEQAADACAAAIRGTGGGE